MGRQRSLVVVVGLVVVVVACGKSTDTVDNGSSSGGAQAIDARYTFSPQTAKRTCATDADCVVVQALTNCQTCCGQGAVARGEAEQAYSAVVEACRQPGAPGGSNCEMGCGQPEPSCFEGTCVMMGLGPPNTCTGSDGGATSDAGAGAPGAPSGAGPACGATAVKTGFDTGIDPSWTNNAPESVKIDSASPLDGASLRVSYAQKDAFLTIPQPNACGARIAFTLRTKLLVSGLSLGRVVAGEGSWFHLRIENCAFSVAEELRTSDAAGLGFGGVTWPVADDTPVRVVLTFDLNAKTMSSTVAPVGAPLPEPRTTPLRGNTTGISAIELGSTHGIQSNAVGTVWLDDLQID